MSVQLTKARQGLTQIRGLLKQGKMQVAIQTFYNSLVLVIKNPLMKQEKEEFSRLTQDALHMLSTNDDFRKNFPLQLSYEPGKERDLLNMLKELLDELNRVAAEEAQAKLAAMQEKRAEGINKGQKLLDEQKFDQAKQVFDTMIRDFKDNTDIKAEAGERFLKAGRFEEAYTYLAAALDDDPSALHLYNRIGIALRKLRRFETAEKYYFKALEYNKEDAHLCFNIGRLYIDWGRWDEVAKWAKRSIKYDPNFAEAQKMFAFAQKKLGAPAQPSN